MHFKIATPERVLLDTEVDSVSLPTSMGEITILPQHIPLVANLLDGEIRYKQQETEKFFATGSGVVEVKKNGEVIVLADSAELSHEIDIEKAEQAREEARKLMAEVPKGGKQFADAVAWFERSQARIKVAKKHRSHRGQSLNSN